MTRSVKFRHNSDSSYHCVPDQLPGVGCGVSLFGTERCELSDFRMRVKDEWKGVFVSNVPMEDAELVVHHGVNGFVEQMHGQEVPRGINHEASVNECRFVFDLNGELMLQAFFILEPGTLKRLEESLKPAQNSDVSICFEVGFIGCDVQAVRLLFGGEDAFELWFFDLNGEFVGEAFEFDAVERPEDEIGDFAVEGFALLVLDEFSEMGELVLIGVDDIVENFAGVLHDVGLFALLVAL